MGETEEMTQITGRPSNRPFVPCGSFANQKDAAAAASVLSFGAQTWRPVQIERAAKGRTHAIRRLS